MTRIAVRWPRRPVAPTSSGPSSRTDRGATVGVSPPVRLEARHVEFRRGATKMLDDVDITIAAGELVAIAGPNGAGKSTLLGVLSGDLDPSAGEVWLDGRPLRDWSSAERAMRRAVMAQREEIAFAFSVGEVVEMGRAPWTGTSRAERDDAEIAAALQLAEVADLVDRYVVSLSGGERARVAFARALAQSTDVLLLDEPTASLDIRHQELVLRVARTRARAGAAVAVVLHDLGLAAAYGDRVLLLSEGRVVADGRPSEVLRPELLSSVYRQEIEVWPHPGTGEPLVLPARGLMGDSGSVLRETQRDREG